MKHEIDKLNARLQDVQVVEEECLHLRTSLEQERRKAQELEKAFLANSQISSESSSTDVESIDDSFNKAELTLNSVAEEEELEEEETVDDLSDEEDGLAGYEDEEDSDISFQSPGGSSIGSEDELDMHSPPGLLVSETISRSCSSSPVSIPERPAHSHAPHASLSKTWTFPRGTQSISDLSADDVDRFFGCLDDLDNTPPMGTYASSEDMGKGLFSSAFASSGDDEDEDLPPFLLPSDVGVVEASIRSLPVVIEEDEEEDVEEESDDDDENDEPQGEEVEGGIIFTFTPPAICITPVLDSQSAPAARSPVRKPVPIFEPFDDEDESESVPFTFPQIRVEQADEEKSDAALLSSPSSDDDEFTKKAVRKGTNSPSSIPRSTALRSFSSCTPPPPSIVTRVTLARSVAPINYPANTFVTPPSKRGGVMPSFIPQPVNSPSKHSTPTKPRSSVPVLRQAQGQPATNAHNEAHIFGQSDSGMVTSVSTELKESSSINSTLYEYPSERQALSSSLSSFMSSPLAARISFQSLSSYIPRSWAPGTAAVASCIGPSNASISSINDVQATVPLLSNVRTRPVQKGGVCI
ncbi:hypothetical protein SERLA73DRAFT_176914 [Serpula lacrymans var. lacrymans S7.3]|uniref:Uncharacterized protein n=1 Tax=Serpula lacrymans var. lacrymans (strain S7.3) TaxID=936435 RepID=F8PQE6_SERL3|nr:hypothetical protein SERLA73DRAFT_176914 [Serpula lacrymans var. lacrymans S7.3]